MLKTFLSYYKPYKWLFVLDLVCIVLVAGVELLFPLATRYAINTLLPQNAYLMFFCVMAVLLLAYILRAGLQYIVSYWGHTMGLCMEIDMKKA